MLISKIKRLYKRFILREAKKQMDFPQESVLIIKTPDYYRLCKNAAFIPTECYPWYKPPLEGEVGTFKGARIIYDKAPEDQTESRPH